jgi:hypothetical protein
VTPEDELYADLPPDATVDGFVEDPSNPGWVEVSFSDGRKATLPKGAAEAMPQTPAAPVAPYGAAFGPPAAPPAVAEPAPAGPVGFDVSGSGLDASLTPDQLAAEEQAAALAPPPAMVPGALPGTARGTPTVDYGEVVAPGSPGGFAPFSQTSSQDTTQTNTVDDPDVMAARVSSAADEEAGVERLRDTMAYQGRRDALDTELDARDEQERQVRRQMRQAELERQEHQRVIQAMEKTPIDEDEFWSGSPGRTAGAWVALALSGFLQGATKGQNPALNQMVQALNHAQDRYVRTQQAQRDSTLRGRERLMGDARNAEDTFRAQLSGIVNKKIDLEAQRAGLQPPPGLETYKAKQAMQVAERQNAIGSRVSEQVSRRVQEEDRATPGTGPQTRFDVALRSLGVDKKRHDQAMTQDKLGDVAVGADRLKVVNDALRALAAKNGGELQAKTPLSWEQLGLAPVAARLGIQNAKEQVNTKQLLEEAKLAFKQTVNIKSIDSENEGKNFNTIMDSGESDTTLAALAQKAQEAEQRAVTTATGVAGGNARRYLDLLRQHAKSDQSLQAARGGEQLQIKRRTGQTAPGAAPAEPTTQAEPAATTGGGPAPRPLAQEGQRREPPQESLRATVQEHADEAGLDADALARIIRFESGGRPGARNQQSGATGAIQWMPQVYENMRKPPGYENVRFEDLPDLTLDEQMPLVIEYFREKGVPADADAGEYYLAVAAPAFLGKDDGQVVYRRGSAAWRQNPAWRPADDGDITVGDIRAKGRSL